MECNPPETYFNGPVVTRDHDQDSLPDDLSRLSLNEPKIYPVEKYVLKEGDLVDKATLDKLTALLLENPYQGTYSLFSGKLYKSDDLKTVLNVTDEQLDSAFRLLQPSVIRGYWRIVHYQYLNEVLTVLLRISRQRGWSLASLDGHELVQAMLDHGYPADISIYCLLNFATKSKTDVCVWALDAQMVSVRFALHILCAFKKITLKAFLLKWANAGLPIGLELLAGEIVLEKIGNEYWVSLPSDVYGPHLTPVYHEMQ